MAVTVASLKPARRAQPWRLYGAATLLSVALLVQLLPQPGFLRWSSVVLAAQAAWWCHAWYRAQARAANRRLIAARLTRLPDDFVILHDLTLPAPWGKTRIDEVILSRYGAVAVSAGLPEGWMCERVEAIRTLLFHKGCLQPSMKVMPLILLPPRARVPRQVEPLVKVVWVEYLRFDHLAPSQQPVLNDTQVRAVAHCLLSASTQ
ncbi:MAG TPA: nuclease-related domain-containing protein [Symbiobacteriaceae bacterium]|nr:nuclease-related domain-containing protein [Symbiobacteriaceae bacterium]